jgi:hypothetical protein
MMEVIQARKKDGVPTPLYCLNYGDRYFAHNANR